LIPAGLFLSCVIQIKIREAGLSDTGIIAEFSLRLAWETEQRRLDPDLLQAGVAALLHDDAKGKYFLAESGVGGQLAIAGQLSITYEWSDWRNGNFWWIQSVYVDKAFRGQGVFSSLFRHVQSLAKVTKEVCGLRLYMEANNETARRAYHRLGFQQTHYQMFEIEFAIHEPAKSANPEIS